MGTLANLYSQNANRRQASTEGALNRGYQASAQSAENFSREGIARDQQQLQDVMQARQIQAERQMQQQRIAAAQEQQRQAISGEAALIGVKVGQQEQLLMRQRENGLAEISRMQADGTLDMNDPETARSVNDAIAELKTGINFTQRRMQGQQAETYKQQAALRQEEAKIQATNIETMKGLQLKAAQGQMSTGVLINPTNGVPHWVRVDDKGNIVPMDVGGKGDQQQAQGEWAHLARKGTNQLDEAAAMKDAMSYAKFNTDPVYTEKKDANGNTSAVLDKEATDKKINDLARRRLEGIKREFGEANGGRSGQQESAPRGQAAKDKPPAEGDVSPAVQMLNELSIKVYSLPPAVKEQAAPQLRTIQKLVTKNGSAEEITDPGERAQYADAYRRLVQLLDTPKPGPNLGRAIPSFR